MDGRKSFLRLIVVGVGCALLNPLGAYSAGWASPINTPHARALFPPLAWASRPETKEVATKKVDGLEVTLLAAPPMGPEEMAKRMPGMMAMPEMGPMPGMKPTHWLGVIITDMKTGRAVQGLSITLTAKAKGVARERKLIGMPGSYANNISLPARGGYRVLVKIAGAPLKQAVEVSFDFEYR